ncbi:MAG: major facilitator superfamily 1 [Verrucomicrobiales bacterium]|nr:major facilitator superfamily 1 [Verrucomicrobiales bacterium]
MPGPTDPIPNGYDSPTGQRPEITGVTIPVAPRHDPYAAFRSRGYSFFIIGNLLSIIGRQMLAVAVEWEIYARTHSATALGLVGLVIAVPVVALSLPAGHLADRFSRKQIILITQVLSAITSIALAFVSWKHLAIPNVPVLRAGNDGLSMIAAVFERHHPAFHFDDASIPLIYLLLFISGTARTFGWAARSSFFPTLVPRDAFSNAVTWNNSVFQIGSVVGPSISGLLIARVGFPCVYVIDAICAFAFFLLALPIPRSQRIGPRAEKNAWRSLAAGMRFVFSKNVILATITLDLFAVLLGGATALLPVFADQILHCGPVGLGWMRAAPAVGAFAMAVVVAYLPPMRQAGKTLLWCVSGFGIATIIFGLSKVFWLSLGMLFFVGAFDSVSVIIRGSIVQLVTPDDMRGRVSAVNNIFIGTSNEFGALESGLTAALFGPVVSVVGGGIGTIVTVFGAAWRWREIRKIGVLDKTLR